MADEIKEDWQKSNEGSDNVQPKASFGAGIATGLNASLTGFVGTTTHMAYNRPDINLGQHLYPYMTDNMTVTMGGILATGYSAHRTYKCMKDFMPPSNPVKFGLGTTTALALTVPLLASSLNPEGFADFITDKIDNTARYEVEGRSPALEDILEENGLENPEI